MSSYIGQVPGHGQIQYFTFIATAGQTVFSGIDSNKYVLNYAVGFCDVFLNGRRLTPTSDYTATDGSTITLQSAASVNDVIFVASASTFDTADWVTNAVNYVYTATAGQNTFTGADDNSQTLSYVNGTILVSVNGINIPQSDYTATNGTSVVLNSGVNVGDIVQIFSLRTMAVVNFLPLTGGTVTGTITVGNSSVNTQITAGNIALNGSTLLIGNSTSNVVLTGTTLTISNSTSNVSISPGPASINAIATNTFTVGNTLYVVANGNVGIGNSTPNYKVVVDGIVGGANSRFAVGAGLSAAAPDYSFAADGSMGMFRLPGVLGFATGGTERMRIDASGQLAIGTNSAVGSLDVLRGNSTVPVTVAKFGSTGNGNTNRGSKIVIAAGGLSGNVDVVELVGYQEAPNTVANAASFAINVANTSGNLVERMRIDRSGRVGVGTATPSSYFHVASFTAGDSPTLTVSNDGTATGNPTINLARNSQDFAEIMNHAGGSGMKYTYAHPNSGGHRFYTSTDGGVTRNLRVTIDHGGNVGIGVLTTNVASQLAVVGNGYFSDSIGLGASLNSQIQFNQSITVTDAYQMYQPSMTVNPNTAITTAQGYYNQYPIIYNYSNNQNTTTGTQYGSSYVNNRWLMYNYTGGYVGAAYGYWADVRNYAAATSGNTGVMNSVFGTLVQIRSFANGNITTAYGGQNVIQPAAANATVYGNITTAYGTHNSIGLNSANASVGTGYLYYGQYPASANITSTAWGMYITGEDKNYFSGNVGIGNTTPAGALHITTAGGNMILKTHESTSTYTAEIAIDNSNLYIRHNSANRGIKFGNTAADWFSIAANGNIGIGAGPSFYGINATLTGTSGAYFYNATASGYAVYGNSLLYIGVRGTSDSSTAVYGNSNSGVGVYGISVSSYALRGVSTSGNPILVGNNTNNFFYLNSTGSMFAPYVYSTTVGATNRDLYIDSTGLVGYVSSLRESKIDISDIQNVDWIYDLDPVSFYFRKKDEDGKYLNEPENPEELEYGLIAEDVEPINEQLCMYDVAEDGTETLAGVKYSKLIIPLLKAVQDLKQELNLAKQRISELENK